MKTLTREEVVKEELRIQKNLMKWLKKQRELQNEICTHPNVSRIAKGNTGNYDPMEDRYWYTCSCPDCRRVWTEDQ